MLKEDFLSCRSRLEKAGIADAGFEAGCLLEHVAGLSRASRLAQPQLELSDEQKARLEELLSMRERRYPLQYLLKSWSFCGFELEVGEGVLIPRDDTEVVLGLCLEYLGGRAGAKVIDLCAGSGALSIALSKLGGSQVEAVELSDKAIYFLKKNIDKNKASVRATAGDIFTCHTEFADGEYDLIVSNPPYIKSSELPGLQPEVQFEPAMALDGGESGYDFYEAIISLWGRKLRRGGALAFELGEGQARHVKELMAAKGFKSLRTAADFGGTQRAIIGTMDPL